MELRELGLGKRDSPERFGAVNGNEDSANK